MSLHDSASDQWRVHINYIPNQQRVILQLNKKKKKTKKKNKRTATEGGSNAIRGPTAVTIQRRRKTNPRPAKIWKTFNMETAVEKVEAMVNVE